MLRCALILFAVILLGTVSVPAAAQTPDYWRVGAVPAYVPIVGLIDIGVKPRAKEGWDGQLPEDPYLPGRSGVAILLYRQNGPGWAGPTGFYYYDYEPPIPWGGSRTWWDIYLWSQNYAVSGNEVVIDFGAEWPAPVGYTARLVIDRVPESLAWTGPMEFNLRIDNWWGFNPLTLPVAEVTDPLQGTRMHLTVYAVPEPSSFIALGFAVIGLGGVGLRRRRR